MTQSSLTAEEALLGLLHALAGDCENTDGWTCAATDLRQAADLITRQAEEIERLRGMIEEAPELTPEIARRAQISIGGKVVREATGTATQPIDVEGLVQKITTKMQMARDESGSDPISSAYAEAAMRPIATAILTSMKEEIERLRLLGADLRRVGDDKMAFRSEWLAACKAWDAALSSKPVARQSSVEGA